MLLFVAGAVFGEVQVSLFVAGAVFGEIWNDSRSAKCCIFQYKNARGGRERSPRLRGGLRTDGFMVGSCSDHGRIGRALEMTFHPFSADFGRSISWQAQYLVSLDYDACCSAHCK